MKKLFKPNEKYSFMSDHKRLIKTRFFKIDITEYYDPHYLEICIWIRGLREACYILTRWFKIPLDKYSLTLFRYNKAVEKEHIIKHKLHLLEVEKFEYGEVEDER